MAAEPANISKINPTDPTIEISSSNNDEPISAVKSRRSNELIIALCGAVGSGVSELEEILEEQLVQKGYTVEHIRLSELIIAQQPTDKHDDLKKLVGYDRYNELQNLGDIIRKDKGESRLSALAIDEIATRRQYLKDNNKINSLEDSPRIAYIINQIKNPKEVELLNVVYRNNFYMLGLLRNEAERKANLVSNQMNDVQVSELINRDRKDIEKFGQHVEKSLYLSDYFIRNIDDTKILKGSVERFIHLIHGTEHITPTVDETGIFSAFSASLRSACLSRQVGAAISDESGNIITTGCNDVPSFGGGLYNTNSASDKRCFNYGRECHNDKHKSLLKNEMKAILEESNIGDAENLADKLINNTKAKSLIEYSRAVHAEMDAITSLARSSNSSSENKVLYCTTYPCHVCARHIVASGIKRVVYIEPYEKSLALQLHSDSITHPENKSDPTKVLFINFEGVSPQRYAKFFGYGQPRKANDGKAISYSILESGHVDPQYLDSYQDYELKVISSLGE